MHYIHMGNLQLFFAVYIAAIHSHLDAFQLRIIQVSVVTSIPPLHCTALHWGARSSTYVGLINIIIFVASPLTLYV